ncbi:uncharacterized protein LOC135126003 isoform X2 [Zophobas morio]|uniref:uncharacterized protein LOC135126003 isoform X2 n=1 Tax=Zophobas morio TaxID=2755281 RepID=UPI0030827AD2
MDQQLPQFPQSGVVFVPIPAQISVGCVQLASSSIRMPVVSPNVCCAVIVSPHSGPEWSRVQRHPGEKSKVSTKRKPAWIKPGTMASAGLIASCEGHNRSAFGD